MTSGYVRCMLVTAVLNFSLLLARPVEAQVEARIEIPEAEVYVLGDDIPLIWEFTNLSTNPVAMLWEGCCRLNGRLDISADGAPVDVLPPGAASFHSYSKAAELKPKVPGQFSSLLGDWVRLPRGGQYQIGGRYTGVLPSQTPQVEPGLDLWRGTAVASATYVEVVSVEDYLNQRNERSAKRGWSLALSGVETLPPLEPIDLELTIKNVSKTRRTFAWPGATQVWWVDRNGIRLAQATRQIRQRGEEIELDPGESFLRTITIDSADLNGAPFGVYQLFIDLKGSETEGVRVPSNALSVAWKLTDDQLAQLLNDAAAGPSIGMRNPTLKLLRVYLDQLGGRLNGLRETALNQEGAKLRDELRLAACLQPLSPRPGRVAMPITIGAGGQTALDFPEKVPVSCGDLAAAGGVEQLLAAFTVRRHLGWDIGVELRGRDDTTMNQFFTFVTALDSSGMKLSAPAFHALPNHSGGTNFVQFVTNPVPSNLLVRLDAGNLTIAAKRAVPGQPIWMNTFRTEEVLTIMTEPIESSNLEAWVAGQGITSPRVLVMTDGTQTWKEFRGAIEPIWATVSRLSVVLTRD